MWRKQREGEEEGQREKERDRAHNAFIDFQRIALFFLEDFTGRVKMTHGSAPPADRILSKSDTEHSWTTYALCTDTVVLVLDH